MGIVNPGIPEMEAMFLKECMELDIFIETGTYKGLTALKMSKDFKMVYTIEKSEMLFNLCQNKLKGIQNVSVIFGDSRRHLDLILEKENNILFWLDAHYSGGETYGENDECPLLDELKVIFKYKKNYVILIDDASVLLQMEFDK